MFSRSVFVTLWTTALCPWDFSNKNTGVGCHFHFPGDLPNPGTEPTSPVSPALQADSLPTEPLGKPFFFSPYYLQTP